MAVLSVIDSWSSSSYMMRMTTQDAMRIAAEASVDVRTVKRWLDDKPLRNLTRERIEAAAKKLKIRKT